MLLGIIASILGVLALTVALVTRREIKNFMNASGDQDLPKLLKKHHLRQVELNSIMHAMNKNQSGLNKKVSTGFRRSGFVRFNPYRDTGGDQSFCLAMLDDRNTGYILTAVHGREGTRVYAKYVDKGESDYKLSSEEVRALKQALSQK